MTRRSRFGLACYLLVIAALAAWCLNFLLRSDFTPYHAVAAGVMRPLP